MVDKMHDIVAPLLPDHADVLIIVPPFIRLRTPPLAPHLLAAIAKREGRKCGVLYANILFAAEIGVELYGAITAMSTRALLGDRIFAAAAYNVPPLGWETTAGRRVFEERRSENENITWAQYVDVEQRAEPWVASLAEALADRNFQIVGCSTQFEQTTASIALLNQIKQFRPDTITLLGGSNCDGEMADGIAALGTAVDYFFSGESDSTFPAFLEAVERGERPSGRVIQGKPIQELDALPTPSFADYYAQMEEIFPYALHRDTLWQGMWVPAESSRGCWWGQKHHCTFCGLNGTGIGFREKSPDRVIEDLSRLVDEHPLETVQVQMTDNIMPFTYFRSLIPALIESPIGAELFYEQKANLSLTQVKALKDAGVDIIQPGIEALSTSYLKRMDKGTTAAQNIALLRYARSVRLRITWNLLSDFPGDELEELEATYSLMPLLRHLAPPTGLGSLSIDRFSPFFDRPQDYGIEAVTPLPQYAEILPQGANVKRIAYFFEGKYESATRANPDLVAAMRQEIAIWSEAWTGDGHAAPMLRLHPSPSGRDFVLIDTRGLPGADRMQVVDRDRAAAALLGPRHASAAAVDWALKHKVCAPIEGRTVPLAVADVSVMQGLELGESAEQTPMPAVHLH